MGDIAPCMPFISKSLIMLIWKEVKNKFESKRLPFSKQRNFCINILGKTKRDYYANLN